MGADPLRSGLREAGDDPARVELCFDAPFEEEHGVGVLTDGVAVVGVGYARGARPSRG